MSGEEKESSKRKAEPETKKDTSSKTKDLEVIQKEENDKDKCQINANKQ